MAKKKERKARPTIGEFLNNHFQIRQKGWAIHLKKESEMTAYPILSVELDYIYPQ